MSLHAPLPTVHGACGDCGCIHTLAGSADAAEALRALFAEIDGCPPLSAALTDAGGKMLGVLLAQSPDGLAVLRAHSGSLPWPSAEPSAIDFVPTVLDRSRLATAEADTLAALASLEQAIAALPLADARYRLDAARAAAGLEAERRRAHFHSARHERAAQRTEAHDPAQLVAIERAAQAARREEKAAIAQERAAVAPYEAAVRELERSETELLVKRRARSGSLMALFHESVTLTSGGGRVRTLPAVFASGLAALGQPGRGVPTGAGECCAPKLLDAANRQRLRPLALAEAWWEPPTSRLARPDHGQPRAPCAEKCAPILGFLLCDQPSA